jgi:hypothetical protein
MNTPKGTRPYTAIVSKEGNVERMQRVEATDRRKAVHAALLWFWYEYHGSMGPADKAMTVSDPYNEVSYGPRFRCNDRMNKLLPSDVRFRVMRESKGELMIDRSAGSPHHRPNSLRRTKRRRDFGRFIAPGVRQMKNGVLYYRITVRPSASRDGTVYQKRKYRDIRLEARLLESALGEIQMRGLHLLHKEGAARKTKVRELKVVAHVLGLISLEGKDRRGLGKILRRYETPKAKAA